MQQRSLLLSLTLSVALGASLPSRPSPAATPGEAEALKSTLTPVGAERAGNATGTIPAWTGGYTTPAPGYQEGAPRPDPFGADKPLFSITAANVAQYADQLPEGAKALFAKYPDYRMDIY